MTPDEWNAKHRHEPLDAREFSPVSCPCCGARMFFPHQDDMENDRVVRCSSRRSCVQTTIRNPLYVRTER